MVRIARDIEDIGERRVLDPLIIAKFLGLLPADFDLAKGLAEAAAALPPTPEQIESIARKYGMAKSEVAKILGDFQQDQVAPTEKALSRVLQLFPNLEDDRQLSVSIFEHQELLRERAVSLSTKEAESSGLVRDRYSTFRKSFRDLGVIEAFHIPIVPLVQAAYGYTRDDFDPQKTTIRAFPADGMDRDGHVPIYVNVTESEGILFEFDRKRILDWLISNSLVDNDDTTNDPKLWFLRNISPIDPRSDPSGPVQKQVFTLIHTISHALTKSITVPSGIASESVGELFFPNIPAILLFTHEGSGFKTGGLEDLFQNKIFIWLNMTVERLRTCVYDPVCYNSSACCHHCLIVSENACSHFNADLSRKVLLGSKNPRFTGFWEASVDQFL